MISSVNITAMSRDLIRGGRIEVKHANWTAAGELIICFATKPPDRYSSLHGYIVKRVLRSATMLLFRSTFGLREEIGLSSPLRNDL